MAVKKRVNRKKKGRKSGNQKSKTLLIYYASILGFALVYHVLSNQDWFLSLAEPIFHGYATLGSGILNVLGEGTHSVAEEIRSSSFNLAIKEGCDAITPMILFSMAILAFPIQMKYKWQGVIFGLGALFVLNIIRIVSLYFIGKNFSYELFNFFHVDFWSVLYLLFALLLWLFWMRWALIHKNAVQA